MSDQTDTSHKAKKRRFHEESNKSEETRSNKLDSSESIDVGKNKDALETNSSDENKKKRNDNEYIKSTEIISEQSENTKSNDDGKGDTVDDMKNTVMGVDETHMEDTDMSDDDGVNYRDVREFAILDEIYDSDDGEVGGNGQGSDSEHELSPEQVEALMKSSEMNDIIVKEKFDTDKFSSEHSEDLPPDWVKKEYSAGILFYIHVPTNIVSTTRPYMLGPGSIKKHKLCMNAIPCLDYLRRLEKSNETESVESIAALDQSNTLLKENNAPSNENIAPSTENSAPSNENIDISTENSEALNDNSLSSGQTTQAPSKHTDTKCHADSVQNNSGNFLTHEAAIKYFKKLYKYKVVKMRKFSSWKMKRAFVHKQKCQNKITKNIPAAPEGTIVISVPMLNTRTNRLELQDWSLNPKGKSYVCILHEYLQRAVKTRPVYDFKELENAKTPYLATIKLNNMQYGSGIGSSKRIAKLEAAKATLEILLPQLKELWKKSDSSTTSAVLNDEDKYTLFDTVKITDPKVTQYCQALGESPPYTMLVSCIEKNFDEGSQEIRQSSKPIGKDKFLFTLEIEGHSDTVKCASKKEGKELAAQTILQQLHPQVHYLGSLLRLYGNAVLKGIKEKKSHGSDEKAPKKKVNDSPNFEVLRSLREAMNVIYADRQYLLKEGGFVAPPDIDACIMDMYKEMKSKHKKTVSSTKDVKDTSSIQNTDAGTSQMSDSTPRQTLNVQYLNENASQTSNSNSETPVSIKTEVDSNDS
uniref:Microprocessor complex subunit DGCR8 n=1 Tax=Cacopsylla melanoneura TaxID=428564 RepID=A0A8D9FEU6_9HEMI